MNNVWARSSLLFDTGIPNLAHGLINIRQRAVFIHGRCMTLAFGLYVGGGGILCEFYSQFYHVPSVLFIADPRLRQLYNIESYVRYVRCSVLFSTHTEERISTLDCVWAKQRFGNFRDAAV